MTFRILGRFVPALFFCLVATSTLCAADDRLTIGDKAPQLDIEHWLQDGNGFFKPVESFADGSVYVVEFWATWCAPCRMGMPKLAELQNQYRGQKVQIIGVSNEPVEEVDAMMEQEHPEVKKTFREITSAYSLTTDPDQSVFEDYMAAAGQSGIPTAFIVGKTGVIEWIGSPFEMEETLGKVVAGNWDRSAFKQQYDAEIQLEEDFARIAALERDGEIDQAIAFADQKAEQAKVPEIQSRWTSLKNQLKLVYKKIDQETIDYYRRQFKLFQENENLKGMISIGGELYSVLEMDGEVKTLDSEAIAALESMDPSQESERLRAVYHNTIALLSEATGDFEKALTQQAAAMELLSEREQQRMMPFLEELREKAQQAKQKSPQDSKQ